MLRHLRYVRPNATDANASRISLLRLPDDILILVLHALHNGIRRPYTPEQWSSRRLCREGFVNLSMASKHMRFLAGPLLFHTITLGPSWSPRRACQSLVAICRCEGVARHSRQLKIDLWMDAFAHSSQEEVANRLVSLIAAMGRLKVLSISVAPTTTRMLRRVFEDARVTFPHIHDLVLSPHMEWIVALCPEVQRLSSNDWVFTSDANIPYELNFIEAASQATRLQHFSLHCRWERRLLDEVLQSMPGLQGLGMTGGSWSICLEAILPILVHFHSLRRLELVNAQDVAREVPRRYPDDDLFPHTHQWEQISPVQERITRMVFGQLPRLEELVLGRNFNARLVINPQSYLHVNWIITVYNDDAASLIQHQWTEHLSRDVSRARQGLAAEAAPSFDDGDRRPKHVCNIEGQHAFMQDPGFQQRTDDDGLEDEMAELTEQISLRSRSDGGGDSGGSGG